MSQQKKRKKKNKYEAKKEKRENNTVSQYISYGKQVNLVGLINKMVKLLHFKKAIMTNLFLKGAIFANNLQAKDIQRDIYLQQSYQIDEQLQKYLMQPDNTKSVQKQQIEKQQFIKKNYQSISELQQIEEQVISNICCWNCTLQLQQQVVFLLEPDEVNDESGHIDALFCSYPCGFSWIRDSDADKFLKIQRVNSLKNFFKLKTGKILQQIYYAPSKYGLQKFGGEMTGEQFKLQVHQLEKKNI